MADKGINPLLLALHRQQEQKWLDREVKQAKAENREVKQPIIIKG